MLWSETDVIITDPGESCHLHKAAARQQLNDLAVQAASSSVWSIHRHRVLGVVHPAQQVVRGGLRLGERNTLQHTGANVVPDGW